MLRLKRVYLEWRLREAIRDEEYWTSEIERATLNRGIARVRIELARRRLFEQRYPIKDRGIA